jgi:hypothetical protein
VNTLEAVDQCITTTLKGDSTMSAMISNRIYREQAPQNATYPLVVFGLMSAADRNMLGPVRAFTRGQYMVKAITTGDGFATADDIMDRVDAILQDKRLTVSGYRVMPLYREEIARYVETIGGVRYNHYAFIYRFYSYAL